MGHQALFRPGDRLRIILFTLIGSVGILLGVSILNRSLTAETPSDGERSVGITLAEPEKKETSEEAGGMARKNPGALRPVPAPPSVIGNSSSIALVIPELNPALPSFDPGGLLGNLSDIIMTEESVDRKPKVLTGGIEYPEMAKRRGIEGRVIVSVLIDKAGAVERVTIVEASPPGIFDQSVLQAVAGWEFSPAMYEGRPVRVSARIPIDFKLD